MMWAVECTAYLFESTLWACLCVSRTACANSHITEPFHRPVEAGDTLFSTALLSLKQFPQLGLTELSFCHHLKQANSLFALRAQLVMQPYQHVRLHTSVVSMPLNPSLCLTNPTPRTSSKVASECSG